MPTGRSGSSGDTITKKADQPLEDDRDEGAEGADGDGEGRDPDKPHVGREITLLFQDGIQRRQKSMLSCDV
jgi:hypothetical protein